MTASGRRSAMPLGGSDRRAILIGGDLVVVAAVTAVALRLGAIRSGWEWSSGFLAAHAWWVVVFGSLWVVLAAANGLYDPRRAADRWASALLSVKVSAQIVLLWALAYFVPPPWTLVRHVAVFFTAGAAVAMPVWRQVYAATVGHPAFRRRVLIVGAGVAGRTVLDALRTAAPRDYEPVGFVDDDPRLAGTVVGGVPVLADRGGLVEAARRTGATDVVLAVTRGAHGDLLAALLDAREQGVAVTAMPVLYERVTGRVPVEHIGDHWAVALPLETGGGLYPLLGRGADVAFGLVGLAVLAAVLPVVGPLIRLGSPGPVLFRQERVGRGGRTFTLLKLRTMVADAEADGPRWAAPDDPRVTGIGRILRRTRLDELPQAWNVLRGEMSLVGPRPERPEFVSCLARDIPFYRARHAVRPGLTGWAAIHEGYAGTTEDVLVKLQRDLYYIKHRSPFLDLYILLRTAAAVVRLRGR